MKRYTRDPQSGYPAPTSTNIIGCVICKHCQLPLLMSLWAAVHCTCTGEVTGFKRSWVWLLVKAQLHNVSGDNQEYNLSNAHWKLIYTFSVTSNAFIGSLVSRDICIVSLKWLFTYGTLNPTVLHYITLVLVNFAGQWVLMLYDREDPASYRACFRDFKRSRPMKEKWAPLMCFNAVLHPLT